MKIRVIVLVILFSLSVFASESFKVNESIEVIAQKDNKKGIDYIDRSLIESLSANSNDEVLSLFPSVFLSTRGANGLQADISYRGSRGNQVGISILGVPLNNLQTYHHNLDIPLAPEDIKSVKLTSSVEADITPYSFAGVINFDVGENKNEFNHLAYGSNDYYHIYARENGLSYMFEGSSGYVENSRYNKSNVTYQFNYNGARFLTAFNSKHFDARDFYAPYPSYERTQTSLLIADLGKTKFYGTRHYDIFTLDKNNPEFFRNITETYKTGIIHQKKTGFGDFRFNLEFNSMDSKIMGNHNLTTFVLKYSKGINLFNLSVKTGVNYYSATNRGKYLLPFILANKVVGNIALFFGLSESVRVPDFTELYYYSPVNRGNVDLREEKSLNYQLTVTYRALKGALFFRDEKNLIDWVRKGEYWHAENGVQSNVYGIDISLNFKKISIGYEHIHRDKINFETKYSYYYPKNRFKLIFKGRDVVIDYSYLDINNLNKASVLNVTFWGVGFYLKVLNVFDEEYQTYPGIPMPGRAIVFGYRMRGPIISD